MVKKGWRWWVWIFIGVLAAISLYRGCLDVVKEGAIKHLEEREFLKTLEDVK